MCTVPHIFLRKKGTALEKCVTERFVPLDTLMPIFREQLEAGASVRFSPRGISMLPMLRQGRDSVLLSPLPKKLKPFDIALYRRDDGKYVLHRIVKVGQSITCIGDNQFEEEPGLRMDQMIGVVTAFYRDERRISVRSLGYRLYCRLWHLTRPLRHFLRRAKGWLRRHLRKNH